MMKKILSILLALIVLSAINIMSSISIEVGMISVIFGTIITASVIVWGFDA